MSDLNQIRSKYQGVVLVSFTMVSGSVLFAGLIWFLLSSKNEPAVSNTEMYRYFAWGASLFVIALSFILKNKFLTNDSQVAKADISKDNIIQKLNMSIIIAMALCEGAVVLGGLIAFLTRNPQDMLVPVIMGLIGFAVHFPRYSDWEHRIKNN